MVTTVVNQFSGPAYALIGDATTLAGAGLVALGLLPNVDVKTEWVRQNATNEIGQGLSDGQSGALQGIMATLTLHNKSAAILEALISGASDETTSVKLSEAYATISPQNLVIIPLSAYGDGVTGANNIWIPAAVSDDVSSFIYQLQRGAGVNDDANPYTVTMRGTLDDTYNEGYRLGWIGDPADAGATFTLPDGY